MSRPLVFLDTETTGLHDDRRAWEIAMARREDGITHVVTIFVDVRDIAVAEADPAALTIGRFHQRHPGLGAALPEGALHLREADAVALVDEWTAGAEIFGINPLFDTECLEAAMRRHGRTPQWWRTPVDVAVLARGFVLGQGDMPHRGSDKLSAQCGVAAPVEDRHTALGDTLWTVRWFDHMISAGLAYGCGERVSTGTETR